MLITGWGRYPRIQAQAETFARLESLNCGKPFDSADGLRPLLAEPQSAIVHALGRSYGDSALADRVILTRRSRLILGFDEEQGVIDCQAGVSLAEILDVALPRGWFLAVTPGTKLVSVGGAIAADVHGKNHHLAGCFSQCVESLRLMLPDGQVVTCSAVENAELFRATCGGMGLTGVILSARLRLKRVPSALIRQRTLKARNLRDVFELFEASASWPYSVAWIDCMARGEAMGRSLLMLGDHAETGPLRLRPPRKMSAPFDLPASWLNPWTISRFNAVYYHRIRKRQTDSVVGLEPFFYPLDAILHWNRLYGRAGFTQYQCVLPLAASYEGLGAVLRTSAAAGKGSFLAVLKLCGSANDNPLSFPLEGYSLALDFKIEAGLFELLDELDRIVLDHGGRLYLAKDARMGPAMMRAGYPGLPVFLALRDRLGLRETFQSLQSQRLEI